MKKILAYLSIFLVFTSFIVFNTNGFSDLVQAKLNKYSKENAPEKVYVHTDKPYYSIDETIWFTAYLVNGVTHQKSTKSAVVYVELINENDILLSKKKLYTNNISVAGDIKINKEWKEGSYLLRAYTNYMRNGEPEYFFQKTINIWEIDTQGQSDGGALITNKSDTAEKPDLNFYPEGGYLVENVTSKVAFKIKNSFNQNTAIAGSITDGDGNVISQFKSLEFGLGLFNLTPQPNTKYFASIEFNGNTYRYELPKALKQGFNLSINYLKNNLIINVNSSMPEGLKGSYLVYHQRGKMLYNRLETENLPNSTVKLSTKSIPNGVSHITLFNSDGNPVCERLVFIDNAKNKAKVYISKDQETLGTKEKISLKLNVSDFDGSSLPSQLSMSVRDLDAMPYNKDSNNIKTWLLLNSDLRGNIENPGYFFSNDADAKSKYLLDLVMMTNGWRRFTWQHLLNEDDKHNTTFEAEKGIMISGKTKELESPNQEISALTTLSFFGDTVVEVPSRRSDSLGNFEFGPFIFMDSLQTIIQAKLVDTKVEKGAFRDVKISINEVSNSSPKVLRNEKLTFLKNQELPSEDFKKVSKYIRDINFKYDEERQKLEEVVVIAKKKSQAEKRREEISSRAFFDMPTYRMDLETDTSLIKQSSVINLLTQFPGLVRRGTGISQRGSAGNPKFILNNLVVDLETVTGLPVTDISFIDYYRGAEASLYTDSANGVIVIYTRLGASSFSRNVKRKPGIINFTTEGFYTAKEFYAPDYSKDDDLNLVMADVRSTLHWEPQITISREMQTAEISFYSCDIKGSYLIEVQGISESGIPLYQTETFTVK